MTSGSDTTVWTDRNSTHRRASSQHTQETARAPLRHAIRRFSQSLLKHRNDHLISHQFAVFYSFPRSSFNQSSGFYGSLDRSKSKSLNLLDLKAQLDDSEQRRTMLVEKLADAKDTIRVSATIMSCSSAFFIATHLWFLFIDFILFSETISEAGCD